MTSRLWRRLGPEFSAEWPTLKPQLLDAIVTGRYKAATTATSYTEQLIAEIGQDAPPVAALDPARILATAPDGRSLQTLYDEPVIWTKTAIKEGLTPEAALARAGNMLTSLTLTVLADTRRGVYEADIIRRPQLTGYVRMLNPPSCDRCVILAGKWFRWNEGFLRHPRCDCQHIPAAEDAAGDYRTDPYEYFKTLTPKQQDRVFGRGPARAIRDGGDIYRVTNVRMRGLATAKGRMRYGTPSRLTVDDIYRLAGADRARAIQLLTQEGFILPRRQIAVRYSPGVRTDAEVLAAGRGRGTYRIGGTTVTPGRAARYDAVETGQRDPLNRATMTSAERRLYDASYRLQYARRNGYIPRSVGLNSADVASGARGILATPDRLAQLEADLARQIARIRPGTSLHRVYNALGLDDAATAASTFDRITGNSVPAAPAQAGASGAGGTTPPRRPPAGGYAPEPDGSDPDELAAYWRRRQDALGFDIGPETLDPWEIRVAERMRERGETIDWIAKLPSTPTHDFRWNRDGREVLVEAKSPKAKYETIRARIYDAVKRARAHNPPVIKDVFLIDIGLDPLTPELREQLQRYNLDRSRYQVAELWLMSDDGATLTPIDLL